MKIHAEIHEIASCARSDLTLDRNLILIKPNFISLGNMYRCITSSSKLISANWILKFVRLFVRHFPLISDSKHHVTICSDKLEIILTNSDFISDSKNFRAQHWFARHTWSAVILQLLTISDLGQWYSRSEPIKIIFTTIDSPKKFSACHKNGFTWCRL